MSDDELCHIYLQMEKLELKEVRLFLQRHATCDSAEIQNFS